MAIYFMFPIRTYVVVSTIDPGCNQDEIISLITEGSSTGKVRCGKEPTHPDSSPTHSVFN